MPNSIKECIVKVNTSSIKLLSYSYPYSKHMALLLKRIFPLSLFFCASTYILIEKFILKISQCDQEIPQSYAADKTMAPWG